MLFLKHLLSAFVFIRSDSSNHCMSVCVPVTSWETVNRFLPNFRPETLMKHCLSLQFSLSSQKHNGHFACSFPDISSKSLNIFGAKNVSKETLERNKAQVARPVYFSLSFIAFKQHEGMGQTLFAHSRTCVSNSSKWVQCMLSTQEKNRRNFYLHLRHRWEGVCCILLA